MTSRMIRVLYAGVATLAIAACHSDATGPGDGGSPLPPGIGLQLNPFITAALASPVFLTQPLDDGRIFVVEQGGRIRVVRNGILQATPFLDISTRVLAGGERGLLSVAFHPQYATNHFFYVYFTTQANGDIRIERFTTTSNAEVQAPRFRPQYIAIGYLDNGGGILAPGELAGEQHRQIRTGVDSLNRKH